MRGRLSHSGSQPRGLARRCYVDISGCRNKHDMRGFLQVPLDVEQRMQSRAPCETVGISDHIESVLMGLTHPMTLAP